MANSTLLHSIFFLALMALCFSQVSSTSRRALDQLKKTAFTVTLRHVDSGKNLTKFERIQRGIKRGNNRLQRFNSMVLAAAADDQVQSPIMAGNGEYLMDLSIGTPPDSYSAILDTGSDLIWTQCKPCTECFQQPTPIFDPKKSSSFSKLSCSSDLCEALPQSTCDRDGCEYLYSYGDYSTTQGFMATETFTFGDASVRKVGFGCGEENQGDGFSQGAGLVGLGRGPLSLVSQMKETKFSYCLTPVDDTKKSKLLIGSTASVDSSSLLTTPLLKNPSQPTFYYLPLQGISVGDTRLPIKQSTFSIQEDGSGGMIIDSGTTITYLEESAFDALAEEFTSQVKLPVDKSEGTGLDVCFNLPSDTKEVEVPKLVFHFEGADVELPSDNYMIGDSSMGVVCLAMGSSSGLSILGNLQQQNMLVIYDLAKETMSFQHTQCDQL
ncbi:hypothetical protein SLE2022_096000 [Rubroshorea leprosula]